jgi:endogenous inhibitor of DNA gyrase (YacG/DUF329 family)
VEKRRRKVAKFIVTYSDQKGQKQTQEVEIKRSGKPEPEINRIAKALGWKVETFHQEPDGEAVTQKAFANLNISVTCGGCGKQTLHQLTGEAKIAPDGGLFQTGQKTRKVRAAEKGPRTYTRSCPKCNKTMKRSARSIRLHIDRCGDQRYVLALQKANKRKQELYALSQGGGQANAVSGGGA